MRVADFISCERLLAANFTNLCHGSGSELRVLAGAVPNGSWPWNGRQAAPKSLEFTFLLYLSLSFPPFGTGDIAFHPQLHRDDSADRKLRVLV
jgi:hypothetical protein